MNKQYMNYYEHKTIDNTKYEFSHYYCKIENDIFLSRFENDIDNINNYDLTIASTNENVKVKELEIEDKNLITYEEFISLYEKYKNLFKIDLFKKFNCLSF